MLGRAGEAGQKRRLADAERGVVEWQTPSEIQRFLALQSKRVWMTRRAQEEAAQAALNTSETQTEARNDSSDNSRESLDLRRAMRDLDDIEEAQLFGGETKMEGSGPGRTEP